MRRLAAKRWLSPLGAYERLVAQRELRRDPVQYGVMHEFERLHQELLTYEPPPPVRNPLSGGWLSSFAERVGLGTRREDAYSYVPRGVYVWGGVGSGKTRMMDVFFDAVSRVGKQRVHYDEFMLSVHRGLHEAKQSLAGDGRLAMQFVANRILENGALLCLDEFQVVDVADALVLKALFEALFEKGAVFVATSNRAPRMLYHNGIQRQLFEPFIPLLERRCAVASVEASSTDYRLEIGSGETARVYFVDDRESWEACKRRLAKKLDDHAKLRVRGTSRLVDVPRCDLAARACLFDFDELCGSTVGAADYLAISAAFGVVFLDKIPLLDLSDLNRTRRFITLVDALYESRVVLVAHAEAPPTRLFVQDKLRPGGGNKTDRDEAFAFDRTASRLVEMGSSDYLRRSRARRPPLAIDVLRAPEENFDIDKLFAALDVDDSGFLDYSELAALVADVSELKRGHRNVATQEVDLALSALDTNNDGLVSRDELRHYLLGRPDGLGYFDDFIFYATPLPNGGGGGGGGTNGASQQ
ncbi:hypothetical protein CTAYLR_003676 [Chrysophaeum taylorii]|uniref:EF-hand domain-containing protein n=1 Tax=Chrysophaeum taylorii TaxID=2483200 RepID=A0AAD7UD39_9STRA|nr:hypothetical protein CTAYLR_003676 [Chrysophaeum taylorii]